MQEYLDQARAERARRAEVTEAVMADLERRVDAWEAFFMFYGRLLKIVIVSPTSPICLKSTFHA